MSVVQFHNHSELDFGRLKADPEHISQHLQSNTSDQNRDIHWADRREQWQKAVTAREQLRRYDTPEQRFIIIQFAKDGIFSIWMEVFKDDVDMRQRLNQRIPWYCL